ncbi:hypothetical protein FOL47_011173 [Perkinsus chesapeaki]|uniref:Uncharacterized protein n=1 Tax=Perkinsus chesapeaki TaxID=330153 RepID=A0A7J6L0U6_PERCH|nr:hypothetical protein FOL47_011173 [Perkinsus chesapeaki]
MIQQRPPPVNRRPRGPAKGPSPPSKPRQDGREQSGARQMPPSSEPVASPRESGDRLVGRNILGQAQAEFDRLVSESGKLRKQLAAAQQLSTSQRATIDELESKLESSQGEVDKLKKEGTGREVELRGSLSSAQKKVTELQSTVKRLETELSAAREESEARGQACDQLGEQIARLQAENQSSVAELASLREHVLRLQGGSTHRGGSRSSGSHHRRHRGRRYRPSSKQSMSLTADSTLPVGSSSSEIPGGRGVRSSEGAAVFLERKSREIHALKRELEIARKDNAAMYAALRANDQIHAPPSVAHPPLPRATMLPPLSGLAENAGGFGMMSRLLNLDPVLPKMAIQRELQARNLSPNRRGF